MAKETLSVYELAVNKAQLVRTEAQKNTTATNAIRTATNEMKKVWSGKSQLALSEKVTAAEHTLSSVTAMLNGYADNLENWARGMMELTNSKQ